MASGPLLHVGMTAMCPHGAGQVQAIPSNTRVLLGGQPAVTVSDTFLIAGCPFTVPPSKPQPCMKVQWISPAMRVQIGGQPALLTTSSGICQSADQIPAGPPTISVTQMRAQGT